MIPPSEEQPDASYVEDASSVFRDIGATPFDISDAHKGLGFARPNCLIVGPKPARSPSITAAQPAPARRENDAVRREIRANPRRFR
jgi:hypothetical protein